jgi:hypothetical protein
MAKTSNMGELNITDINKFVKNSHGTNPIKTHKADINNPGKLHTTRNNASSLVILVNLSMFIRAGFIISQFIYDGLT